MIMSNDFVSICKSPDGRMNIYDSDGNFIDYLYDKGSLSKKDEEKIFNEFYEKVLSCDTAKQVILGLRKFCENGYFWDTDLDVPKEELVKEYGQEWVNRIGDKYIVTREI